MAMKRVLSKEYSTIRYTDDVLSEALKNINHKFMNELPDEAEEHIFSKKFIRKMRRLLRANQYFGGCLWLEKTARIAAASAAVIICFIGVNQVSVRAFDFNIWQAIVTKTNDFVNIHFIKDRNETETVQESHRCKIIIPPEEYIFVNDDVMDNMTVQNLVSDKGTISYIESEITETADIYITAVENGEDEIISGWKVTYIHGEQVITAVFYDEQYYHIITVQGEDASRSFVNRIIEALEVN